MKDIETIPHSEGFCNECGEWTQVLPRTIGEIAER